MWSGAFGVPQGDVFGAVYLNKLIMVVIEMITWYTYDFSLIHKIIF